MSTVYTWRATVAALVLAAFVAAYFISPIAEALNTHSVDFESSSGQSLSITDGSQTGLNLSGDLSLEAWVKFESLHPTAANPLIFKRVATSDERSYSFYAYPFANQLNLDTQTDGLNAGCAVNVSWTPSTGTWYHVAVTKSGTSVKFYLDGSQLGSTQTCGNASIYDGTAPLEVGGWTSESTYLDGIMDDVRVWNVARTDQQIADDYDTELNGNESGLVGYWKLNNSLSDSTTNGNNLTNNNSATFSEDVNFGGFVEDLANRKSSNENVTSSTVLQDDDHLTLSLGANKTYVVDGVIFASSTSATPDIIIAFAGQTGSIIRVGYTNDVNEMVLDSGDESSRINLPANTPTSIHIKGTVVTSSTSGDFRLKWAQATSNGNPTTVMAGSYLRAEEI